MRRAMFTRHCPERPGRSRIERTLSLGQVADGTVLRSNLFHPNIVLINCFYYKSKRAAAVIRDAFNEDRWLHWHVFGFNLRAVAQSNVGHRPRTASGIRFQTREGEEGRSSSPSGPCSTKRSYQR